MSLVSGLQDSVVNGLPKAFGPWEGPALTYMYTDSKGLMTTGTGNLLDTVPGSAAPTAKALALDWKNADGSKASAAQITEAWKAVKAGFPAVQSTASAKLSTIRLTPEAVDSLVQQTIQQNWDVLSRIFPGASSAPADAQLLLLSNAWASGAGFAGTGGTKPGPYGSGSVGFLAKFNADPPDYVGAQAAMQAAMAHEESINPGIIPRNKGQAVMAKNAAEVLARKLDRSVLWFKPDSLVNGKLVPTENPVGGGGGGEDNGTGTRESSGGFPWVFFMVIAVAGGVGWGLYKMGVY